MWAAADSAPDFDKTKLVTVALLLGAGSALALGLLPFQAGAILLGLAYGAVGMLRPRWLPGLLVLVAVLLCWEAAVQSSKIFGQQYDTWLHLGLIRRVLEHGPYPPDTNYLGHSAAPRTSLTHYIQAIAWWITSLPGHTLWRASSPVVVACLVATSYFAHHELLRDRAAAALASVFYLSQKFFAVGWAVYPRVTAPALYLLTIGLLARGLRTSRPRLFLMAGLALGSTVFGRIIDRRGHPLVVYGILEGAIGLWALLLPSMMGVLNHFYAEIYQSLNPGFYGLSLIRFVLCFLLLLVPTTLMGGTYPALVRYATDHLSQVGRRASQLYAATR